MARSIKAPAAPAPPDPNAELEKSALRKLKEARRHKAEWRPDLWEAYFLAAPHRCRAMESHDDTRHHPKDAGEVNISLPAELCTDFATLLMNTYMPENEQWAARAPSYAMPDDIKPKAKEILDAQDNKIFEAITASNFYSECTKMLIPDAAIGTVAMWIDNIHPSEPTHCQAIPIHELDGCLGPFGHADTVFHTKHYEYDELEAVLPKTAMPQFVKDEQVKGNGKKRVPVTRGFWRDWSDQGDVTHIYVVLIKNKLVDSKTLKGVGAVQLIVGRFNPMAEWFWANGPMIQYLPDWRGLDELTLKKFKQIDFTLDPPIAFPDDSFANIEEGIETGMAYAIRPGTGGDVKNLYEPHPTNAAIYETQDIVQGIKRGFFLDFPEQTGDTPPSATQWTDEVTKAQRRIGTPGKPFWREFCAAVFLRYAFLLEKAGVNKEVKVDGKKVACTPVNPAEIAAQAQDVSAFTKFAQIGGMFAPEELKIWTDGLETLKKVSAKLGADKVWVIRKPSEVAPAIQQIKQLLTGQAPGAPAIGNQSVAPPPDAGGAAPKPAELMSRGP